jgi:hypothetical protein
VVAGDDGDVVAGLETLCLEAAAEPDGLALEVGPGQGAADVGHRDVGGLAAGDGPERRGVSHV